MWLHLYPLLKLVCEKCGVIGFSVNFASKPAHTLDLQQILG